jgi:tetratricopeptide (TPR) repeat protein
MAEFRYRAYISYSHKDEVWARWLHHGLESYRLPRHLVGNKSELGKVPARIRPVFRDRDDLSSSSDLEVTVQQALAESENLVVICSPAAVASRWVNEEIRQFADQGRADRVFCIIVDGEPDADGSLSECLPSALADIGLQEPLAADVRDWADGKHVAKLKIIAGLLGIRLDELRQRDLQRRRKRQSLAGLAIAAALALTVITVVSQISERQEREKAEQLATFIVDLGERLKTDADLETLALISAEASRHLQNLDPERLSPETGKKVALAFRQVGQVSQFQGKPDEALEAFKRSRDLLSSLHDKYPGVPGLIFELGNAEFYIGNLHLEQHRHEDALESMQNYHRLTRELLDTDPQNPDWILELSYSHNNLAALQLDSGKGVNAETLEHVEEAVSLMEKVAGLKPDDEAVAGVYAITLAWAADAQYQSCNLEETLRLRGRVLELSEFSTGKDPGNNDLKEQYAFALTGMAGAQRATGRVEFAEKNLELAISILQELFAADPGKIQYRDQALYRQVMLLRLLADTGRYEPARDLAKAIEESFESIESHEKPGKTDQDEYVKFLLVYSDIELQSGNLETAKSYLQTAMQLLPDSAAGDTGDIFELSRLVEARYQWWRLNGSGKYDPFPDMSEFFPVSGGEFRSCIEADSAARLFVMQGDSTGATREAGYLKSNGYADPWFIRFCEDNGL